MKQVFTKSIEQLSQHFSIDPHQGLKNAEADKRLQEYGPNRLQEVKSTFWGILFLRQFQNPLLVVLFLGALLSLYIAHYVDAIAILVIILINASISFMQELKSQQSMQALKEMASPKCWVRREDAWLEIPAAELVPGDVIKLETGTIVPADARLMDAVSLQVDEAALTGESDPVYKHHRVITDPNTPLADRKNCVFMSTAVTHGYATAIVNATGMKTEVGHIAQLLAETEAPLTPLQQRIQKLSKTLIFAALIAVFLVLLLGYFQGMALLSMANTGISLAVAAIPEGLPTVVTIVLTLGAHQMMRSKALAKHLTSVETLGATTVICSDKTGTLTQNKMQVKHLWVGGQKIEVSGLGYIPQGEFRDAKSGQLIQVDAHPALQDMLQKAVLCSESRLVENAGEYSVQGLPTEGAVVVAGAKAQIHKSSLLSSYEVVQTLPFDSERKMMSVVVRDADGQAWLYVKGAPDVVVSRSDEVECDDGIHPIHLMHSKIESVVADYAQQALRTLAVAYRKLSNEELQEIDVCLEKGLTFVGVFGIIDPPRPEAIEAVKQCRDAGIGVVMITGDHAATATAIAKQMQILDPKVDSRHQVITGTQLNGLDEQALFDEVKNIKVFARVTPEHKLRIVKALQAHQEVVAMTGDGVNDAPALRSSDIGVAMGLNGSGVAKESADLILLDDNFATIVTAVREGRRIYDNIRKFIRQGLTANVSEVIALLWAFVLISAQVNERGEVSVLLTLAPLMILWVNLVSDGIPALALGVDGAEDNIMKRSPRNTQESFFAGQLHWRILLRGTVLGTMTFVVFKMSLDAGYSPAYAQTLAFLTLIFGQLVHIFDARTFSTLYERNPFDNRMLIVAVLLSTALSLAVVYHPWGHWVFGTSSVSLSHLGAVMLFSALPTFALSAIKYKTRWRWL
ncbi:HAD-IC family P-type ATPase [Thiomicrorhabdus indica]|uniref:cation-translocating P-type ATPase n=1 Tax=Thiomicrorhabdus indica TaxID=2267253 RepID=UPI002AA8FF23|nr:HAD-IC family P-type ATPase [Thiomicrorhabdus indica]